MTELNCPKDDLEGNQSYVVTYSKDASVAIDINQKNDLENQNNGVIQLQGVCKGYGRGKSKHSVLKSLDMTVFEGQIYGLLGPSACGKSTLLKCIIGMENVDSGSISVYGEPAGPNSKSGVPGRRVGYMPQDLALYGEFTIKETLLYYSKLYGMSPEMFQKRLDFLLKFLDLPCKKQHVGSMSGGQQRRVSLAVALLHEPDLLILDEPTVGVDPLLRQAIWEHLVELATPDSDGKATTIIITTHYVEECRRANRVGFMRLGKLLAEGNPTNLLNEYNEPNLEDLFLKLSKKDENVESIKDVEQSEEASLIEGTDDLHDQSSKLKNVTIASNGNLVVATTSKCVTSRNQGNTGVSAFKKIGACMMKTFNRMKKRHAFYFEFVLPIIQFSLFCVAIGQDPKELPIAIVNGESINGTNCDFNSTSFDACPVTVDSWSGMPSPNENMENFACRYLSFFDWNMAKPIYFQNMTLAVQSVKDGDTWGVISFQEDFSESLYKRIIEESCAEDMTVINQKLHDQSSVNIKMDITNQNIGYSLQLMMVEAFDKFLKDMLQKCELPKELGDMPLVFDEPIYGNSKLTFSDFMAPGIILVILQISSLGISAMIVIMERNEGVLDRGWIAGVTAGQYALAHFFVCFVYTLVQVIILIVTMVFILQVPVEGSIALALVLLMLQGICGTTLGLVISALCTSEQDAIQVTMGIFYPNLILSGIIWPLESMPTALRYIAYVLPQTLASQAMRDILLRGWGLTYMPVWRGFIVTIAWIIVTFVLFQRLLKK